jgi:hypothetical protein
MKKVPHSSLLLVISGVLFLALGLSEFIDEEWRITEVCAGSSYGHRDWYLNRPRLTGDPHGQAPLLWATSSLLKAMQE